MTRATALRPKVIGHAFSNDETMETTQRNPLSRTPRPRTPRQRLTTDTRTFTRVSNASTNLESVIMNVRKDKVSRVQEWIKLTKPTPVQLLHKISEESPTHSRILTLIMHELEKLPQSCFPTDAAELHSSGREIAAISTKRDGLNEKASELLLEEQRLLKSLEAATARHQVLLDRLEAVEHVFNKCTFVDYEREAMERNAREQENVMSTRREVYEESANYNELWVQNSRLKSETEELQQRIDAERWLHLELASARAAEVVKAKG